MLKLARQLVREKYVVGYWAWELPNVPSEWRYGVPFVHQIWAPSQFTADAILPIADGRPVCVVPHPVALSRPIVGAHTDATKRPFTVLTIFNASSSFERKNPLASIAAFVRAFGKDSSTRLVVKSSNLAAFPPGHHAIMEAMQGAPNVILIDKTMAETEINQLYQDCDAVISLHRSEGFGLTIAEAMLRGVPVVATGWSGNTDFLNSETGICIPYNLIPAKDPQGTYNHSEMKWADADVAVAANALRRLRDDPVLAARLGRQAEIFAAGRWHARSYSAAVRDHLGLQK